MTASAAKPTAPSAASGGSQTLERGLRVLLLLGDHPRGLRVSSIAELLGTHRAGVYRLLRPLESINLVERDPGGRYSLGTGLIGLAANVRARLQIVAARELQKLANELGATCALTIRHGDDAVVAQVLEPAKSKMHIMYRPGLRHPLTQAASGIAILAADPPKRGDRAKVLTARRQGYAVTHGELFPDATGVAVALFHNDGGSSASASTVWLGSDINEGDAVAGLRRAADGIARAAVNEVQASHPGSRGDSQSSRHEFRNDDDKGGDAQ